MSMFFPDTVGVHHHEEYTMGKRTLLIGSTGGFGGAMLRPLLAAGHEVSVLLRPGRLPRAGVNVIYGDALQFDDLHRAAEGHDNLVCGLNFPYTSWAKNWPQAVTALGRVASEHGARVVFPTNVYGFGPRFSEPLAEDAPRQAPTTQGRLRNEIEDRLIDATASGARLLLIRAGDFFGPGARNTWFHHMTKNAHRGGALLSPAPDSNLLHEWAYLPDLAQVAVRLMNHEEATTESYHFAGHLVSTEDLFAMVEETLGQPRLPRRRIPWRTVRALAPFVPSFRMLRDTRYQWEHCIRLDDQKLRDRLGPLPHTPLNEAIAESLAMLGPMRQVA